MREYRALVGPMAVLLLMGAAILWSPFEPHGPPSGEPAAASGAAASGAAASGAEVDGREPDDTKPDGADRVASWTDEDWAVFEGTVRRALDEGLDAVPLGTSMVELGRSFVGTPYVPGTLEVEGPEGLVVNLTGLDCVTFVENVYALARFIREGSGPLLGDRPRAEDRYEALLTEMRYRNGRIDGYGSRLHYFSDWIADNERRGLVRDVSAELGGTTDAEPIDFMSAHTDAYRQLAEPAHLDRIREVERRLSEAGRSFVPEHRIEDVVDRIEEGDIIAATSTVRGLDVAHTGLALRIDGSVHLLHAPLQGEAVQVSSLPLSERILQLSGQDGIMVARPVER